MTLLDMKQKVLGMIEELNPNSELLTDDPDISAKINEVINQVMFEMARMKKIPRYVEIAVSAGDLVGFATIEKACGNEVYQLNLVGGVSHSIKADGTIIKVLESGTLEVDCYVYPERITKSTKDKGYEFELSNDALEVMPFGIAADLLKSDVSAEYGKAYYDRYIDMLQRLDPRYQMTSITFDGGLSV